MHIDTLREHCLAKPGVTEGFPFTNSTLVFKVMGKMFALVGLDNTPLSINLKCDPERAVELRERYEDVVPGYHMNKKTWNTVVLGGRIAAKEILSWIDESYALVVESLPKKVRSELDAITLKLDAGASSRSKRRAKQ